MAYLPEQPEWTDGVYQLEKSDPVRGGVDGPANRPLIDLLKRTAWLKQRYEEAFSGLGWAELGEWAVGLEVTTPSQIVHYQGYWYRYGGSLPHTITGASPSLDDNDNWFNLGNDVSLRANLGSSEEGMGIALLAIPGSGTLDDLLGGWASPEAWGVVADDETRAHQNSFNFFRMFEYLRSRGGGVVECKPRSIYYSDFVQFIPGNVKIRGNGARVIFINPISAYGRGGFILGSSREFNYEAAKSAYLSGNYPASIVNTSFVDPGQKQYLRDNQNFVQAENITIYDLVLEALFTDATRWGGYAFNCVNAQHIEISNCATVGWTEGINVGSDVPPNTPSCHDVKINGLTVIRGDLVRTYYAGFFFANSTGCRISKSTLLAPLTDGTLNGSFGATNFTEDCVIEDITVPRLGRTASSEGILVNNSKGCLVRNALIGNAKSAASTFYADADMNDENKPNVFDGITGVDCDQVLAITGKYASFSNINGINCTQEVLFRNGNATGNKLKFTPKSFNVGPTSTQILYWYLINNIVDKWTRKYTWLRPLDMLKSPFTYLTTWNANTQVKMATGTTVTFMYKIPPDVRAASGFTLYGNFSAGAQAAAVLNAANNSIFTIDLITMSAADGNSTDPVVLLTLSRNAKDSGDGDFTLSSSYQAVAPGFLPAAGLSGSADGTMYLRVTCVNGVANNTLKEIGFRYYGD
ncbi:TPA: phage tail protein [Klebsiella michiganensis]|nr:phage tail protein [Klebsiella michiganensis]